MLLSLLPFAGVAEVELQVIEQFVRQTLPFAVRREAQVPVPHAAFDPARNQFDATEMMHAALDRCPADATRLLAVTERDIFIPMLTFIFGQAQLDGTAAMVSLARLRCEFYGLPPRQETFLDRCRKETLHELGHTFGLVHCLDRSCAMSLSINIAQIDQKRAALCHDCKILLSEKLEAAGPDSGPAEE